ncbi:MAG: M48 family metallopeptidase [bacterium]|nr:M48 family metallopeptidase [bacterium]
MPSATDTSGLDLQATDLHSVRMAIDKRQRSFELDGQTHTYSLERRRRRGVTIQLEPRLGLRVMAPSRMPLREIDKVLANESIWLRRKLTAWSQWEREHPPLKFVDGDLLPLLGELWTLMVREDELCKRPSVRRDKRLGGPGSIMLRLPAGLPAQRKRELAASSLDSWYRRLARQLIEARILHWQGVVGRKPKAVTIRDTRTRWGSCSSTGTLSFCWRILLARPEVLDYVVVHELCHLVQPNHSREFWNLLASIIPDYQEERTWLRDHGQELYI